MKKIKACFQCGIKFPCLSKPAATCKKKQVWQEIEILDKMPSESEVQSINTDGINVFKVEK